MELFRTVSMGANGGAQTAQQQNGKLSVDMAGTPFPNQIPALVKAFVSERLLYGSDYWTPAAGSLAQIASIDTAEQPAGDTWRALTTRNAAELLPERLRQG